MVDGVRSNYYKDQTYDVGDDNTIPNADQAPMVFIRPKVDNQWVGWFQHSSPTEGADANKLRYFTLQGLWNAAPHEFKSTVFRPFVHRPATPLDYGVHILDPAGNTVLDSAVPLLTIKHVHWSANGLTSDHTFPDPDGDLGVAISSLNVTGQHQPNGNGGFLGGAFDPHYGYAMNRANGVITIRHAITTDRSQYNAPYPTPVLIIAARVPI